MSCRYPECADPLGHVHAEDLPLPVRVAVALGCKPVEYRRGEWSCGCRNNAHAQAGFDGAPGEGGGIENFDTDWAATGPLIERLCLGLVWRGDAWQAFVDLDAAVIAFDALPLIAVCKLILALKEAGKL